MNVGDLQVWWIPQVPGKPFEVPIKTLAEGVKIMDVLADYDQFQYDNRIKGDYANAGGICQWSDNSDGEGTPGWESWYDEETGEDDPRKFLSADEYARPPDEYTDESYALEQMVTAQWLEFEAQYEGPAKARTGKGPSPLQTHESENET